MGLWQRRSRNRSLRANGVEPEPGNYAGVKRYARYLKRVVAVSKGVKNPDRYLHAAERNRRHG